MDVKKGLMFVVLLILVSSFVSAVWYNPFSWNQPGIGDEQISVGEGGANIQQRFIDLENLNVENPSDYIFVAISSETNAHGATLDSGNYLYAPELPADLNTNFENIHSCNGVTPILYLSADTNAHASMTQSQAYNIPVCHKAVSACQFVANGNCPAGKDAVVCLSANTNAHLSKCNVVNAYTNRICCTVAKTGEAVAPAEQDGLFGSDCDNNFDCDSRFCDPNGVCNLKGSGEDCIAAEQCVSGFCDFGGQEVFAGGHCTDELAQENMPCRNTNDCVQGLTCNVEHVCVRQGGGNVPNGGPCPGDNDALCQSGNCVNNVCVPPGGQQQCDVQNPQNPCGAGMVCDQGFCVQPLCGNPNDLDCDDILNDNDLCPNYKSPDNSDTDGDGVGNVCDTLCPNTPEGEDVGANGCSLTEDADGDGRPDVECEAAGGVYCSSKKCINGEVVTDERRSGNCCKPSVDGGKVVCSDEFFDPTLGQMVNRETSDCIDDNGDGQGTRTVVVNGETTYEPCTTIPSNQRGSGEVPFLGIISLLLAVVILGLFYGLKLNRKL